MLGTALMTVLALSFLLAACGVKQDPLPYVETYRDEVAAKPAAKPSPQTLDDKAPQKPTGQGRK